MKKKKQRNLLPPHLQVPVTLFMAVVFVVLLYFRLGPGSKPKAAVPATPAALATTTAPATLITDLSTGAKELRALLAAQPEASTELPALASNPFFPAEAVLQALEAAQEGEPESMAEGEVVAQAEAAPVVVVRAVPALSAVMVGGRSGGMAILNGQYLHVGDKIDGYELAAIQEKRVLLRDESGETWVDLNAGPLGSSSR